MNSVKVFCRKNKPLCVLALFTFMSILTTGVYFRASFIALLPLFVSLVIMVLQANVNRYALLIGAFNSLLYCYYYYTLGLMSSCLSAVLISFPFQLFSFFNWSRKTNGSVTELKKLNNWQRILVIAFFLVGWMGLLWTMGLLEGSAHSGLDTLTTTLGLATMILTLLRFSEYVVFQSISGVISIWLNATIVIEGNLKNVTYLIYSVYCLICILLAARRLYLSMHPTPKIKSIRATKDVRGRRL